LSGYKFTDAEIKHITDNFSKKKIKDIANDLQRSSGAIAGYCHRQRKKSKGELFSLYKRYYLREWDEHEIEYLHDNMGLKTFEEMGRYLRRTPVSVKEYAYKSKLSLYDNFYTCRQLGKELNVRLTYISRWANRNLIGSKRAFFKGLYGRTPMIFMEEDIVQFLKDYYFLFTPNKIAHPYFRNIVKDAYIKNEKSKVTSS
jgi:hypothetical protein